MNREQFAAELRSVLTHLDDFQTLRASPLLTLLCPLAERSPVALQTEIVAAIEALKHDDNAATVHFAEVLHYRYVEHLAPNAVAFQLGISERQLRREQTNAIERLAEQLWPRAQSMLDDAALDDIPAPDNAVDREVHWLRQHDPNTTESIAAVLDKALADVKALAAKYRVHLLRTTMLRSAQTTLPTSALRQAMLTTLAALIPLAADGELCLATSTTANATLLTLTTADKQPVPHFDEDSRAALAVARQLLLPFGGDVQYSTEPTVTVTLAVPAPASVPILLVDDNPDARRLFQRYVACSRFRLIATSDPTQVLPLIHEHAVQAVVLDIMMPEIDGWDLLTQLRYHPATQTLPVAICTVLPQRELSHLLGAQLFVPKPVTQQQFLEMLQQLTGAAATTPAGAP